ncbi:MAG: MAPEG family protein [Gammaproteobacteria bacterium]|nr:MAPEG family protein [Gammaproteobacteria bacterium]MBU2058472.1 MAPEG family protein [Gammaproteobacteria bacterium]MBU2176475.1 MAPEG family protein [Gammaproteobacteria bacterium]MBU2248583.1 MAPEG family protein [Gammaproteobacteria bacterium]MBU2345554.1 MAPEG family protein [Gammaproteobacteria bacterium]
MDKWLFGSVLLQVVLTLLMMVLMGKRRFKAAKNRELPYKAFRVMDLTGANEKVITASRNFDNQFQLPVLYLFAVVFALQFGTADLSLVVLGWLFAISRLVHAYVHVGANHVRLRFAVYVFGALMLLLFWLKLSFAYLLA